MGNLKYSGPVLIQRSRSLAYTRRSGADLMRAGPSGQASASSFWQCIPGEGVVGERRQEIPILDDAFTCP